MDIPDETPLKERMEIKGRDRIGEDDGLPASYSLFSTTILRWYSVGELCLPGPSEPFLTTTNYSHN